MPSWTTRRVYGDLMSRTVPAARQLIVEVYQARPKAKAKVVGEVDGFGRYRSLTFDANTLKWLMPILEAAADPRIASIEDKTIIFVSDVRADQVSPFGVAEADAVLNGD